MVLNESGATAVGDVMDTQADPRRQFDFWVGDWEVYSPEGRFYGENRIELLYDGNALAEHWQGAGGMRGTSLNAWEPMSGRWHQTWVDSSGSLLLLDGGLVDGRMVLEGRAPADDERSDATAATEQQRITWTPAADGSVRQCWEVSADGGATWRIAFDGHYRRRAPDPATDP